MHAFWTGMSSPVSVSHREDRNAVPTDERRFLCFTPAVHWEAVREHAICCTPDLFGRRRDRVEPARRRSRVSFRDPLPDTGTRAVVSGHTPRT